MLNSKSTEQRRLDRKLSKLNPNLRKAACGQNRLKVSRSIKSWEKKHAELLKIEETLWRQRSRATWLKDRGKNTKFFHCKANQRRKVNEVKKLKDEDGVWWHGEKNIERVFLNFFTKLFSTSNPNGIDQACMVIQKRLGDDHKRWCDQTFSIGEIGEAINQMHPLKAPGSDGIPALFYQKYWHIVGEEIQSMVLGILNEDKSPASINKTFIALIPKCKNPNSPKHFRLISLCNVVMKIVTKVVANRIKKVLPEVIDEEQSAFVRGRLITDNALMAMECFHWPKKKARGKKGMMALKLDMAKAYDRVEWSFVNYVLLHMGFPPKITKLIMSCITTVSYQILINGQPSRSFFPEKGIRQGDPLSPYIFILCANVLSGLLHKEEAKGSIHGIQVARKAPQITHLLFADDNLLFARANQKEVDSITQVLKVYQLASVQLVNLDKSEVLFSRNVPPIEQNMICNKMGTKTVTILSRYLGLPIVFGRSKKDVFAFVRERVWKKLKGWKEKCLSRAGKEILIKSVAQAIPNYIMSCYKIPEGCCQDIESLIAKFWWGTTESSRKMHWLSWERMGRAKEKGGMGFRGFSEFNKALLGKQCWRLMTDESSLMAKVFKGRYFPRNSFLEAKIGCQPSYAWRSMLQAKDVINLGARWMIGDGKSARIWKDNWLPEQSGFKVWSPITNLHLEATVSELIDEDTKRWKRDLIYNVFNPYEAKQILNIPISLRLPGDCLTCIWHWEKDGNFSVRSAYHLLCDAKDRNLPESFELCDRGLWKNIWKAPVPNTVKNFLWRLARNILPTRSNLGRKGIQMDTICPICLEHEETQEHLFMHCQLSQVLWFTTHLGLHVPNMVSLNKWLMQWLTNSDPLAVQLFSITLWKIWKFRNQVVFKSTKFDPVFIARTI